MRQAAQGAIPGRQIEDTWRFLKAAIDDWLRSYDSRTLLLQQAGALTEDESLPANKAYRKMGRADLLIAGIALAHRATLVTRNVRHFRQLNSIQVENWVD